MEHLEPNPGYTKIIKDPYPLEFPDLEQALIDSLQEFLLELGR